MPRFSKDIPVGEDDEMDTVEAMMRLHLMEARRQFALARMEMAMFDADPAQQSELWGRFNATMRRLMKGEDKEWM